MVDSYTLNSPLISGYDDFMSSQSSELDLFLTNLTGPCQPTPSDQDFAHVFESIGPVNQFIAPKLSMTDSIHDNNSRTWKLVKRSFGIQENDVSLVWKTRCQDFDNTIPHRMFSSLKYEFKLTVPLIDLPFVLCRMTLVEEGTHKNAQEPLKGTIECALSREKDCLAGQLKIQISQKLTYYHTKSSFSLQLTIYDPQGLKDICVLASPFFKVYARKPNADNEKRKNEFGPCESNKKRKEENELSEFTHILDQLIQVTENLEEDDRAKASQLIIQHFFGSNQEYLL
jgi:hypothetical protein